MIDIQNLDKTLSSQKILSGITLNIASGEKVLFLGHNGAGKTTLIRCLLGEYRPDCGKISINGHSLSSERVEALREIAFVPQLPPPIRFTLDELFEYAAKIGHCSVDKIKENSLYFGLDADAHKHKAFYKLSGGMKQKILISIAFSRNADVFIFDEPTANLDSIGRDCFRKLIGAPEMSNKTLIFISHRLEELSSVVTRVIELDLGKVVRDGSV
ncbi:MAG: ABC transporter ATP-binding protein [Burkholderiales bacterium]|jgi:ABC-2 type transport system ATP-binding protein|nr:ABC transporter ATP-binding protein [Burkholderiales bacterium]